MGTKLFRRVECAHAKPGIHARNISDATLARLAPAIRELSYARVGACLTHVRQGRQSAHGAELPRGLAGEPRHLLQRDIDQLRKDVERDLELLRASMTVRLGSIQVVTAGLLFAALKLT